MLTSNERDHLTGLRYLLASAQTSLELYSEGTFAHRLLKAQVREINRDIRRLELRDTARVDGNVIHLTFGKSV